VSRITCVDAIGTRRRIAHLAPGRLPRYRAAPSDKSRGNTFVTLHHAASVSSKL